MEGRDLIQRCLVKKAPFCMVLLKTRFNQDKTTNHIKKPQPTKQTKRNKTLQVLIKLFQSIKNTLLNEISMHKQHVHFSYSVFNYTVITVQTMGDYSSTCCKIKTPFLNKNKLPILHRKMLFV